VDAVRYFEDFGVGQVIELGSHTMTREEMLAFARQFDPQPFHIDEAAARESPFGGLIASGWHTGSVCMRLLVDHLLNSAASLGSPGLEDLRWLKPVRPGDTISPRMTVLETTLSERNPTRGTVRWLAEILNQDGEVVMRMVGRNLFARRPSSPHVSC
jgi:acyl dehydratase